MPSLSQDPSASPSIANDLRVSGTLQKRAILANPSNATSSQALEARPAGEEEGAGVGTQLAAAWDPLKILGKLAQPMHNTFSCTEITEAALSRRKRRQGEFPTSHPQQRRSCSWSGQQSPGSPQPRWPLLTLEEEAME